MAEPTQATLSEHNRSRILSHLYHHGVESRASIAKALELTPAAITKITAKLLEAGVIDETGDIGGSRNRRSIGLTLDKSRFHVVGVKFARSLVEIGVFDLAGKQLADREITAIDPEDIPSAIADVHRIVESLLAADDGIVAIGMAVPGPYLRNIGRTAVVSSMEEWRKVNFLDEFSDAFSVPVFVEHDARAGALAQHLFDPDCDTGSLAYYLIGEGVGLGVLENGRTINGSQGAATEIGHISIDANGERCECGNYGCLESMCSAVTIHRMLVEDGRIVPDAASMTHRDACNALFAAAASGNADARGLVEKIGTIVGYGAVTIFNAFNPERIVLGDIVAGAGQPLLDAVQRVVDERVIPELAEHTTISLSRLPADAAVTGAAAVAITQFLANPSMFFEIA
ncbi:ROK family transcriptional regulator [Bifidobacterium choloepi]|uniref:ROK family transcriptional regulator n=1 Tax=Bifidobacterium choloepi TaxID=2614131 RepID=A0A6I5N0G5_9BIFI|nr:ROK family transcriptional regulator [Bifidobacterium choloepi]NEG70057.1 ROK family transcriptional regulator [Bifidobacterium choloepi]